MAEIYEYFPTADADLDSGEIGGTIVGESSWWEAFDNDPYEVSKYVILNNIGEVAKVQVLSSAVDYADCKMAPWIGTLGPGATISGIRINLRKDGEGSPKVKVYLQIDGVKYYSQTLGDKDLEIRTTTSYIEHEYGWPTVPPWASDALTNWGYAPTEIIFGIEQSVAGTVFINGFRLFMTIDDHTPATPDAPTSLLIETGQDRIDGETGSAGSAEPVPWDAGIAAINNDADIGGLKVKVGTTTGGTELWDSELIQLGEVIDDGASMASFYAGDILQDGITYYMSIKAVTQWCEESAWSSEITFQGVTDSGWWDGDYNARWNVRAGTSHSALKIGYTCDTDAQTGHGEVIDDIAWVNESSGHIATLNGYSYICYIGSTTTDGFIKVYIKRRSPDGTLSARHLVHTTSTLFDSHFAPVMVVGGDDKLKLWVSGHDSQGYYYSTTGADTGSGIDITSWESQVAPAGLNVCTYLRPVVDSNGYLFIFFRDFFGNRGRFAFIKSTDNGATWSGKQFIAHYTDWIVFGPSIYTSNIVLDSNDRVYILLNWFDGYGGNQQARALSMIYADQSGSGSSTTYTNWFELEGGGTSVGTTVPTTPSSACIQYGDCSYIATCANPDTTLDADFVHVTVDYGLVIDDNGYPHCTFAEWPAINQNYVESILWHARWTGSAWDKTDLFNDESLPKLWKYRQGGAMIFDDGFAYIYGFIKPSDLATTKWGGGELYKYRLNNATGAWSGNFMSNNSGKGIGLIWALPVVGDSGHRELCFTRGNDLVWMQDRSLELFLPSGNDVRVVEAYNNGTSIVRTEISRVTLDAWQMNETSIAYALLTAIAANINAPLDTIIQLYSGKYNASAPTIDTDAVFPYLENFESIASNSNLNGNNGWVETNAGAMRVYASDDVPNYSAAHTNKLWDGDRFLLLQLDGSDASEVSEKDLNDAYPSMGTDITDVDIFFHFWVENADGVGGTNRISILLYDTTASKWWEFGVQANGSGTDNPVIPFENDSTTGEVDGSNLYGKRRYHSARIRINSSGCSAWIDGVSEVVNNSEIIVFDKIQIKYYHSSVQTAFILDQLYITDTVDVAPVFTDTQPIKEIAFEFGEGKISNVLQAINAGHRSQAHIIAAAKTAATNLMGLIQTEVGLSSRLAGILISNAIKSKRFAQALIAEASAQGLLSNLTIPERTVSANLAEILIAEAIGTTRLAQAAQGDKAASDAISNLAILLGSDSTTIANILSPEAIDSTSQAHIVEALKTEFTRIAHKVVADATGSTAIMNFLKTDRTGQAKLSEILLGDKQVRVGIANLIKFQADYSLRLMNFLQAEVADNSPLANALLVDKPSSDKIAHIVSKEASTFARLAMSLLSEATFSISMAQLAIAEAQKDTRLMQMFLADKAVSESLAQHVLVQITTSSHLAQKLNIDMGVSVRKSNILIGVVTSFSRMANIAPFFGQSEMCLPQLAILKQGALSLPDKRSSNIRAESRLMIVPERSFMTTQEEDRIMIIDADDRVIIVPEEDRTIY